MRRKIGKRPVVLALLAVGASLGAMLTPGVANANPTAQFTMVQSSGRAGMEMNVEQVDPCPSIKSGTYQVLASFTDASSNVVMDNYPVSTAPKTGVWDTNPATIQIPLTAAQGDGTLNLWCVRSGQTSHAMDYIAQTYNVSGPAASATASQASYATGETVHITANTPCDNVSALMHALTLVDPNETNDLGNGMTFDWSDAPNGYGTWDMSLTVPSFVHDGQGDPVSPAGDYQLIMGCTVDGRWMTFQTVYFTVTVMPLNYVALGDSFSSGEGNEPFESGTAIPGTDECHRSDLAYPKLLDTTSVPDLDLVSGGFFACSGSQTDDIVDSQSANNLNNNEDAQVNHLGTDTQIVTLTIGGNNIGFVDFATACFLNTCKEGSTAYNTATDLIDQDLPFELKEAYHAILTATETSQADIYVLDYPQLVEEKTGEFTAGDNACPYFFDSNNADLLEPHFPWQDAWGAHKVVELLNQAIQQAIEDVRAEDPENARLHYVPTNDAGSPFTGHEICSSSGESSYFNNFDQWFGHPAYTFHPNEDGQAAYAKLMRDALTQQ